MKTRLEAGIDYIELNDGRIVFTEEYLLDRGYCCGNGCMNCPYDYQNVSEPNKTRLINMRSSQAK